MLNTDILDAQSSLNNQFSDCRSFVQYATPFEGGYIPKIAHLCLKRDINNSVVMLPYANDTVRRVNGRGSVSIGAMNNASLDDCPIIHPRSYGLVDDGAVFAVVPPAEVMDHGFIKGSGSLYVTRCRIRQSSKNVLPERFGHTGGLDAFDASDNVRHVVRLKRGTQDISISSGLKGGRSQSGGGTRAKIGSWSKKSRSACDVHIRNLPEGSIVNFLTLTLPFWEVGRGMTGERFKYIWQKMRQWLGYHGVSGGVWFMEAQKTGNPHIHAFLPAVPVSLSSLAEYWADLVAGQVDDDNQRDNVRAKVLAVHLGKVKNGRPCLEPMRKPHAASYYAGKYALKAEQKEFPDAFGNVGRYWGSWGSMRPAWEYVYYVGVDARNAAYALFEVLQDWAYDKGFKSMSRSFPDSPNAFFSRWMRGGVAVMAERFGAAGLVVDDCHWSAE